MNKPTPLIKTKFFVPKVKNEAIRRMKLTRKMKSISQYPLTIIHSGAGYGKSTALALFISEEKQTCCWYSISAADDDILSFLTNLTASIRTVFPQFGAELLQYLNHNNRYICEDEISILCSFFINDLFSLEDEFLLILDDFHLVEHSYTVNRWIEKILEFIPHNLHLIVSSRSKPVWRKLAIMKVQNRLLEITKEDLILTVEEAELLLTDYYNLTVGREELNRIYQLTGGWVIALGMAARQSPNQDGINNFLEQSSRSLQDLFRYFEMEIFMKQPPIIQQFLEQTSILNIMDGQLCDVILGISGSESIIQQLVEKNLFIEKTSELEYRFHPLFQEFLTGRLKQNNRGSYLRLHERCARLLEEKGQWQAAIFHYEKMNQDKAIAALLNHYGLSMLESGELEYLNARLKALSDDIKNIYYRLWFIQGEVYRYRSLYKEAEKCYDIAISAAERDMDPYESSKALEGKAKIYLDTIQPYKAKRLLYKVIEIRETSDKRTDEELGGLYHLLAENLINSGQAKKAERWIQRARELHVPLLDRNLEARLYLRTGSFEKAKGILLDSKKNQEGDNPHLPQSHRETDLLLSLIESFTGNGTNSKSLAQEGIQLGVRNGAPLVEACGWIRMGHAVQILNMYESSLALECYETALEIMDEIKVERGKAEPLMGLCILHGCCGEYEKAIETGYNALKETEKVHDMWLAALIMLSMGMASLYNRHYSKAEEFLAKSKQVFEECGDEYGMTLVLFWYSYYFYEINETTLFRENIEKFLKYVQSGAYEFIFQKRTLFGPRDLQMFAPLLIEANKQNISPQYVPKLLQDMNVSRLDFHPGYTLRIQTLGYFRVWLGEKEIEVRDWQRGKAKELFQLFVTKYGQFITKEDIYELLWPEQSEKNAARDLKVALNALNNALEPRRKARSIPFFIQREGSTYGINQQIHLELDSLIFEDWIKVGLEEKNREKSIQYLRTGLDYYKGDYLPERKYDDWCLNSREKLVVLFLRGAEKLAQLSVGVEDYNQAIELCERILDKDTTWEEAYRLLIYCYYKKNNRPLAIKWYKKCCDILQSEIGVQPLESTQQIYYMVMNAN